MFIRIGQGNMYMEGEKRGLPLSHAGSTLLTPGGHVARTVRSEHVRMTRQFDIFTVRGNDA